MKILIDTHAPQIALIDWTLRGLDGTDVCREVRKAAGSSYIYLILLTSKSGKNDIAEGLSAGADDYVIKPFDPDELRARLKVGMRLIELQQGLASKIKELKDALTNVKQLKGLLPICLYCKNVRDDHDYWSRIEDYLHSAVGSDFSHGICPKCVGKHYPEHFERRKN